MLPNLGRRRTLFTSGSSPTQGGLWRTKHTHMLEWCGCFQSKQGLPVRLLQQEDTQRCETPSPARHRWVSPQNRGGIWQLWFSLLAGSTEVDGSPTPNLWWQTLLFYLRGEIRHEGHCLNQTAHLKRFLLNLLTSIHLFPLKLYRPFTLTCLLFSDMNPFLILSTRCFFSFFKKDKR